MKKISAIGFDWGGVILQGIDRSFADSAAQFLGVDSDVSLDELIFIDDSLHSLLTASEIGYTPIHFLSNEQLIEELESLGIET